MQKLIAFVLAEATNFKAQKRQSIPQSESAPHYFGDSLPQQVSVGKEKAHVEGLEINFEIRAYLPDVVLVEAQVEIEDVFSEKAFELREKLIKKCHEIAKKRGGNFNYSEEYAVAVVSGYNGDPDQFFRYSSQIAGFLKSERLPLDEKEIEYTLSTQIKYAKDDLVILDWDGAFIFDPKGEYKSVTELLQVANLQLLRYRILDHDLDARLGKTAKIMRSKLGRLDIFRNRELKQAFKDVIQIHSISIAEFEAVDRDIKLIGEWYSARLYEMAAKKFKLEPWKQSVKEKLESLEEIYSIVAENFSVSRTHLLEMVQIILFFILQAGWFVLIILEFLYFTR